MLRYHIEKGLVQICFKCLGDFIFPARQVIYGNYDGFLHLKSLNVALPLTKHNQGLVPQKYLKRNPTVRWKVQKSQGQKKHPKRDVL